MVDAIPPNYREPVLNGSLLTRTWSRFISELTERIGSGSPYSLGGLLTTDTTAVGNVGTGEDDLITFLLEKNTMQNDGDTLEIRTFGVFANNTNTKTLKIYLGSTVIFSLTGTTTAFQGKEWCADTTIIKDGSSSQKIVTSFGTNGVVFSEVTAATEDLTSANTIKCTGEATTTNDVVQSGLVIKFFPVR